MAAFLWIQAESFLWYGYTVQRSLYVKTLTEGFFKAKICFWKIAGGMTGCFRRWTSGIGLTSTAGTMVFFTIGTTGTVSVFFIKVGCGTGKAIWGWRSWRGYG
jgi:hypothetical protein